MWAILPPAKQILLIVALTVLVILGLDGLNRWWSNEALPLLRSITTIAFILSAVLATVANWTWRWLWRQFPILNRLIFPDLNGTWIGHLQTSWTDPQTGVNPGPIATTLTIHQGLFDISIKQVTAESTSFSTRVIAEADPRSDRYRLWYSYDNRPKAAFHHRSPQHEGVSWLEICLTDGPNTLDGQYYTSRRSLGDLSFQRQDGD